MINLQRSLSKTINISFFQVYKSSTFYYIYYLGYMSKQKKADDQKEIKPLSAKVRF